MQVASPLNSHAQPYIAPLITNDTQANCTFGKMGSWILIDALWKVKTYAGLINLAEQLTGESKPLVAQLDFYFGRQGQTCQVVGRKSTIKSALQ